MTAPTPTSIRLERKATGCVLSASKPGYASATVEFAKRVSPWFLANIVCGCGPVGMVIDHLLGAIHEFVPAHVELTLAPQAAEPTPHGSEDGEPGCGARRAVRLR